MRVEGTEQSQFISKSKSKSTNNSCSNNHNTRRSNRRNHNNNNSSNNQNGDFPANKKNRSKWRQQSNQLRFEISFSFPFHFLTFLAFVDVIFMGDISPFFSLSFLNSIVCLFYKSIIINRDAIRSMKQVSTNDDNGNEYVHQPSSPDPSFGLLVNLSFLSLSLSQFCVCKVWLVCID